MNKRTEKLIEKARFISLGDDKLLIHIPRYRKFKQMDIVLDEEKNKGKDPLKDTMEVKEVEKEFNYKYQEGYVINKANNVDTVEVGSKILVKVHNIDEFDYIKGVNIIRKYDIVGTLAEKA